MGEIFFSFIEHDKGISMRFSKIPYFWSDFQFLLKKALNLIFCIEMFKLLRKNCETGGIDISDFWKKDKGILAYHMNVLSEIKREIDWRGTRNKLLKRIRKLGRSPDFSARDIRLLKKLANQQRKKGYLDFEEMLYYFPGKSIEQVRDKYYQTSHSSIKACEFK